MDSSHISIWSADPEVSPSISRSSRGRGVGLCFAASTALALAHFLNTSCLGYNCPPSGKCSFLPSGMKFHFRFVLMIPSGFSLPRHSPPSSGPRGSLPGTRQAVCEDVARLGGHLTLASVSVGTWCLGVSSCDAALGALAAAAAPRRHPVTTSTLVPVGSSAHCLHALIDSCSSMALINYRIKCSCSNCPRCDSGNPFRLAAGPVTCPGIHSFIHFFMHVCM